MKYCYNCDRRLGLPKFILNIPELCAKCLRGEGPQPVIPKPAPDPVNSPAHYGGTGTYEVLKVIEAWGLGFHLGSAVKYIARAGKKDPAKEQEDLEKAINCIRRWVEHRQREGK